ncbi:PREDICTED: golgin subfamily A member 6-like protein 22, partial [Vollenhovia emeryi]|uniref:golgin subfamily A member 6-like protein 22 n=1 Tax=Vollenhovia emeryi TaxID=411798 RepID=UPI0005F41007
MTFTGGRGETVIDYVIGDRGAWERIERLEVGGEMDSDHQSITVWLGGKGGKRKKNKGKIWIEKVSWTKEAREEFRKVTEEIEIGEEGVNGAWEELIGKIKKMVRVERKRKRKGGSGGWWGKEGKRRKKEVETMLKEWKRGREVGKIIRKKKEYKVWCEERKREENEKWMKRAKEAKTQKQVWEIINKERKRGIEVNEEIEMKEWDNYFRGLLGGREIGVDGGPGRVRRGGGAEEGEREGEDELEMEEIERAMGKLKKRKAAGEDGIQNE